MQNRRKFGIICSYSPLYNKILSAGLNIIIWEFSPYIQGNTFSITKIRWLTLFKELFPGYTKNYTKPINTKCNVTGY
jgi:hypothetical protein